MKRTLPLLFTTALIAGSLHGQSSAKQENQVPEKTSNIRITVAQILR